MDQQSDSHARASAAHSTITEGSVDFHSENLTISQHPITGDDTSSLTEQPIDVSDTFPRAGATQTMTEASADIESGHLTISQHPITGDDTSSLTEQPISGSDTFPHASAIQTAITEVSADFLSGNLSLSQHPITGSDTSSLTEQPINESDTSRESADGRNEKDILEMMSGKYSQNSHDSNGSGSLGSWRSSEAGSRQSQHGTETQSRPSTRDSEPPGSRPSTGRDSEPLGSRPSTARDSEPLGSALSTPREGYGYIDSQPSTARDSDRGYPHEEPLTPEMMEAGSLSQRVNISQRVNMSGALLDLKPISQSTPYVVGIVDPIAQIKLKSPRKEKEPETKKPDFDVLGVRTVAEGSGGTVVQQRLYKDQGPLRADHNIADPIGFDSSALKGNGVTKRASRGPAMESVHESDESVMSADSMTTKDENRVITAQPNVSAGSATKLGTRYQDTETKYMPEISEVRSTESRQTTSSASNYELHTDTSGRILRSYIYYPPDLKSATPSGQISDVSQMTDVSRAASASRMTNGSRMAGASSLSTASGKGAAYEDVGKIVESAGVEYMSVEERMHLMGGTVPAITQEKYDDTRQGLSQRSDISDTRDGFKMTQRGESISDLPSTYPDSQETVKLARLGSQGVDRLALDQENGGSSLPGSQPLFSQESQSKMSQSQMSQSQTKTSQFESRPVSSHFPQQSSQFSQQADEFGSQPIASQLTQQYSQTSSQPLPSQALSSQPMSSQPLSSQSSQFTYPSQDSLGRRVEDLLKYSYSETVKEAYTDKFSQDGIREMESPSLTARTGYTESPLPSARSPRSARSPPTARSGYSLVSDTERDKLSQERDFGEKEKSPLSTARSVDSQSLVLTVQTERGNQLVIDWVTPESVDEVNQLGMDWVTPKPAERKVQSRQSERSTSSTSIPMPSLSQFYRIEEDGFASQESRKLSGNQSSPRSAQSSTSQLSTTSTIYQDLPQPMSMNLSAEGLKIASKLPSQLGDTSGISQEALSQQGSFPQGASQQGTSPRDLMFQQGRMSRDLSQPASKTPGAIPQYGSGNVMTGSLGSRANDKVRPQTEAPTGIPMYQPSTGQIFTVPDPYLEENRQRLIKQVPLGSFPKRMSPTGSDVDKSDDTLSARIQRLLHGDGKEDGATDQPRQSDLGRPSTGQQTTSITFDSLSRSVSIPLESVLSEDTTGPTDVTKGPSFRKEDERPSSQALVQEAEEIVNRLYPQTGISAPKTNPNLRRAMSNDSLASRVRALLQDTEHLAGPDQESDDSMPAGSQIDYDALQQDLDDIQNKLSRSQDIQAARALDSQNISEDSGADLQDKSKDSSKDSDVIGQTKKFIWDYGADLGYDQGEGRFIGTLKEMPSLDGRYTGSYASFVRTEPEGTSSAKKDQNIQPAPLDLRAKSHADDVSHVTGSSDTSPGEDANGSTDSLARKVSELLGTSPTKQGSQILQEVEESEQEILSGRSQKVDRSYIQYPSDLAPGKTPKIRQVIESDPEDVNAEVTSSQPLSQDVPLSQKSAFMLTPYTTGPFTAFSHATNLLAAQLSKVHTDKFDHSVELRTPFRRDTNRFSDPSQKGRVSDAERFITERAAKSSERHFTVPEVKPHEPYTERVDTRLTDRSVPSGGGDAAVGRSYIQYPSHLWSVTPKEGQGSVSGSRIGHAPSLERGDSKDPLRDAYLQRKKTDSELLPPHERNAVISGLQSDRFMGQFRSDRSENTQTRAGSDPLREAYLAERSLTSERSVRSADAVLETSHEIDADPLATRYRTGRGMFSETKTTSSVVDSMATGRLARRPPSPRSPPSPISRHSPPGGTAGALSPRTSRRSWSPPRDGARSSYKSMSSSRVRPRSTSPSLRPYRPHGSQEVYYVESGQDDSTLSVGHSETTMESTHTGSDDAQGPYIPPHLLGSRRDEKQKQGKGIYGTRTSPKSITPPRPGVPLSTIDEKRVLGDEPGKEKSTEDRWAWQRPHSPPVSPRTGGVSPYERSKEVTEKVAKMTSVAPPMSPRNRSAQSFVSAASRRVDSVTEELKSRPAKSFIDYPSDLKSKTPTEAFRPESKRPESHGHFEEYAYKRPLSPGRSEAWERSDLQRRPVSPGRLEDLESQHRPDLHGRLDSHRRLDSHDAYGSQRRPNSPGRREFGSHRRFDSHERVGTTTTFFDPAFPSRSRSYQGQRSPPRMRDADVFTPLLPDDEPTPDRKAILRRPGSGGTNETRRRELSFQEADEINYITPDTASHADSSIGEVPTTPVRDILQRALEEEEETSSLPPNLNELWDRLQELHPYEGQQQPDRKDKTVEKFSNLLDNPVHYFIRKYQKEREERERQRNGVKPKGLHEKVREVDRRLTDKKSKFNIAKEGEKRHEDLDSTPSSVTPSITSDETTPRGKLMTVFTNADDLTPIPEDSAVSIDAASSDIAQDLTDEKLYRIYDPKRVDPKLVKLQHKLKQQREKHYRQKLREIRRKEKIEKLEKLLGKKKEGKVVDDYDTVSSVSTTSTLNGSSESTLLSSTNGEQSTLKGSTLDTLKETDTSSSTLTPHDTLVHDPRIHDPDNMKCIDESETGTDTDHSVCGCKRMHHREKEIIRKKEEKKQRDYGKKEKPVREIHKPTSTYFEFAKPEKVTQKVKKKSKKKELPAHDTERGQGEHVIYPRTKQTSVSVEVSKHHKQTRDVGTIFPSPMLPRKPGVAMVSEAVQTTPSVTGIERRGVEIVREDKDYGRHPPGVRQSNEDRQQQRVPMSDTNHRSFVSVPVSKSPPPVRKQAVNPSSMFIPESSPVRKTKKQTKSHTSPGSLAWYIPAAEPRPWKKSKKEQKANAAFNEPWQSKENRDPQRGKSDDVAMILSKASDRVAPPPSRPLTLQEAFALRKGDVISRSRERVRKIGLTAEERQLTEALNRDRENLFAYNRKKVANPEAHPYSEQLHKPRKRTLTKSEMRDHTEKIYHKLPEVVQKIEEKKRLERYKTNRLQARLYKKKILNKVLSKAKGWNSAK